jgi:hypothetical protein
MAVDLIQRHFIFLEMNPTETYFPFKSRQVDVTHEGVTSFALMRLIG